MDFNNFRWAKGPEEVGLSRLLGGQGQMAICPLWRHLLLCIIRFDEAEDIFQQALPSMADIQER